MHGACSTGFVGWRMRPDLLTRIMDRLKVPARVRGALKAALPGVLLFALAAAAGYVLGPRLTALAIFAVVAISVLDDIRKELAAGRQTLATVRYAFERCAFASVQATQIVGAATESGLIELEALRKSYDEVARVQRAFLDGRAAVQQPGGDRHVS